MIPGCPNGETHLTLIDYEKLDRTCAQRERPMTASVDRRVNQVLLT